MSPDLTREVHCLLGLPFDAIDLGTAVQRVRMAAIDRSRCFISTPNLNFLVAAQSDSAFRNSVINSDLSLADGMYVVWTARLLGIPIQERVAGSDMFERLRVGSTRELSVYFFGGMEGVAKTACQRLNVEPSGITCAGYQSPGFVSVQDMSTDESIEKINLSGADFLIVSLGAKKGQSWIEYNRKKLSVPVISHLGAVVNFVAGGVGRAPRLAQRLGLEWLWRIKEEPKLWRRYAKDGVAFAKLLVTRVVPYAWFMLTQKPAVGELDATDLDRVEVGAEVVFSLRGVWVQGNLGPLRVNLSSPSLSGKDIRLDLKYVTYVDSAFIGLLLLMYGDRNQQGRRLIVSSLSPKVRRIFMFACAGFLLDTGQSD